MPIAIKEVGQLGAKFANRAANAVPEYKAGILAPKRPQMESAVAAAPTWQAAVSSPAAVNRFKAGLQRAGDAGWAAGASGKGANRYPEGVRAAQAKWVNNTSPFLAVIGALTLSPKGIRGSSANYDRVRQVGDALHAKKVAAAGG